jgi:hypothetical protein
MASNLLPRLLQPRSVVIPDEKAQFERLQSIAAIQQRLQVVLDEGRLLRQSIEVVSGKNDARTEEQDPGLYGTDRFAGRLRKKTDS